MNLLSKNRAIRILLVTRGLSITSLAEKTKHNSSYINQIVNGKRSPSPTLAKKIADALDVEITDIFEVKESIREEV